MSEQCVCTHDRDCHDVDGCTADCGCTWFQSEDEL
jgi:hypothetical protein